jgi:protein O-mannosyl-transferase
MNPRPWIVATVLALSIGIVYGRALNVPFIYDDHATIIENKSITNLRPLLGTSAEPGPLSPPPDLPTSGRPLVNLSFAINYAFGGLNPLGYHLVNIVIHFLASLLIWAIVRRTLVLPYFGDRFAASAGWLAFATATLWALHPLQTEAVIYATQRTELMMAVFYLAAFYCSLRYWLTFPLAGGPVPSDGVSSTRAGRRKKSEASSAATSYRTMWLTLAILACLAGMASKEVMVSAPLMVLLFDRTFISGSLLTALRRFWSLYAGLAATWILLLILMVNAPHGETAGFALRIPMYAWWLTQAKVLLMYLKLAVWPWPLLIYYELPLLDNFAAAWIYVLPVLLLGVATLILLWKNWPLGYLASWVFAILAPTLVVPIVTEVAAERRMYLPLVAIVVFVVVGAWLLAEKVRQSSRGPAAKVSPTTKGQGESVAMRIVLPAFVLAILFALVDVKHLAAYRDEKILWREVIQRQPDNVVAHNNLSAMLLHAGMLPEAVTATQELLALKPDQPVTLNNLGVALTEMGRSSEAVEPLRRAVQLKPEYADGHNNLGLALTNIGRHQEAIAEFEKTLALRPDHGNAQLNMGIALTNIGRYPEAIEQFERVLRVRPGLVKARINLGVASSLSGKNPQAIEQFQLALQADPDNVDAHNNVGLLLAAAGQSNEAIAHFEQALRSGVRRSDIHFNLAEAFRHVGRTNDAIAHYQAAMRLKPDDVQAAMNLAQILTEVNRSPDALATAEKALDVARRSGQADAAKQIEDWLHHFQAELRGSQNSNNKAAPQPAVR